MPLDHADYAETRLREDNAKLKQALEATILQLECLLSSLEYECRPNYPQIQTARQVIRKAKQAL